MLDLLSLLSGNQLMHMSRVNVRIYRADKAGVPLNAALQLAISSSFA